ncbi:hypothetical protein FCH28_24470 [Streptomyces piniterrae]|uniref:Glyoxalase-like domain-containing protein n=1 Tax=Streptomyces piniterrae TaxID=2571125 RepID=A0A4V6WHJ4_9ACTN|nr:VOC family protein [Streptomyces piniterrae]TJZ49468.1 hypothetical protein FCH28_24470 [Streptomyces piniterrae]
MGVSMRVVELECTAPLELGKFWSAVLQAPIGPGADGVYISPQGDGHSMSLYLVEERGAERPRSRTRLWLNPQQGSLASEVERLTELGAVLIEKRWTMETCGLGVAVMVDPEGNEFCIESSDREVAEAERRFEDESDDLDDLGPGASAEGVGVALARITQPPE